MNISSICVPLYLGYIGDDAVGYCLFSCAKASYLNSLEFLIIMYTFDHTMVIGVGKGGKFRFSLSGLLTIPLKSTKQGGWNFQGFKVSFLL